MMKKKGLWVLTSMQIFIYVLVCVSGSYHDTFEYGISTARLQDKFPMLYYVR